MTIGKRVRLVFIAVVLLTLSLSLFACSEKKADNEPTGDLEDILSQIGSDDGEGEKPKPVLYRIVLPEDASPKLIAKASWLAGKLEIATGVSVETVYDHEAVAELDGVLEILLGKTDRIGSERLLGGLRIDDYICASYLDSLVLGGIGDDATVVAIDRFCTSVLPSATAELLIDKQQEFSHIGNYSIDNVRLNGFEISEYTIVYNGQGDLGELSAAESLQRHILEKSGYLLDVIPTSYYRGGRYIAIGVDHENIFRREVADNTGLVAVKNGRVLIAGDGEKRLASAVESFGEMLLDAESDPSCDLWLDEKNDLVFNYGHVSFLLSAYVDIRPEEFSISKINGFTTLIKGSDSEVGIISAVDEKLYDRVMFGATSVKEVSTALGSGRVCSLLYSGTVEIRNEYLYDCSMICYRLDLGEGASILVFYSFCGEKADHGWIAQRVEQIAESEGLGFVSFVSAHSGATTLVASEGVELQHLSSQSVGGILREDHEVSFDY